MPGTRLRTARGEVLTAPAVNSINTFAEPDTVVPRAISGTISGGRVRITLPGKSVAMIALEP